MSERRRILSRPRTRVYDCNYNIGERYYKPVVDSLDKKYGVGNIADRLGASEDSFSRRSPFESRPKRASAYEVDDDMDSDIVSSMQRLKSARAARQELEDELDAMTTERTIKRNSALNAARESILEDDLESAVFGKKKSGYFQDKLLDSVGVNSKLQKSMAEEAITSFKKKAHSAIEEFEDETSRSGLSVISREGPMDGTLRRGQNSAARVTMRVSPKLTKWTALKAGSLVESLQESVDERAARDRARKSRARLADLDAEMDALVERGNARDKRLKGLKALLSDSSSLTDDSSSFQLRQRVTKTDKKVTF